MITAKLQEFFGCEQILLAEGKIPLQIYLLSPNGSPVAITTNMKTFGDKYIQTSLKTCVVATHVILGPRIRMNMKRQHLLNVNYYIVTNKINVKGDLQLIKRAYFSRDKSAGT
jgi:hypothetical protein